MTLNDCLDFDVPAVADVFGMSADRMRELTTQIQSIWDEFVAENENGDSLTWLNTALVLAKSESEKIYIAFKVGIADQVFQSHIDASVNAEDNE